jgi:Uncharacterized conserved protein (DUF2304)
MSIQVVLVMIGSGLLLLSSVVLVRKRLLSVRYGLGWITVSLLGIALSPLLDVIGPGVTHIGFTRTGFSLGVLVGFLSLICLQLSISLSGLHHAIQDLAEHAAQAEFRLRELEQAAALSGDLAQRDESEVS